MMQQMNDDLQLMEAEEGVSRRTAHRDAEDLQAGAADLDATFEAFRQQVQAQASAEAEEVKVLADLVARVRSAIAQTTEKEVATEHAVEQTLAGFSLTDENLHKMWQDIREEVQKNGKEISLHSVARNASFQSVMEVSRSTAQEQRGALDSVQANLGTLHGKVKAMQQQQQDAHMHNRREHGRIIAHLQRSHSNLTATTKVGISALQDLASEITSLKSFEARTSQQERAGQGLVLQDVQKLEENLQRLFEGAQRHVKTLSNRSSLLRREEVGQATRDGMIDRSIQVGVRNRLLPDEENATTGVAQTLAEDQRRVGLDAAIHSKQMASLKSLEKEIQAKLATLKDICQKFATSVTAAKTKQQQILAEQPTQDELRPATDILESEPQQDQLLLRGYDESPGTAPSAHSPLARTSSSCRLPLLAGFLQDSGSACRPGGFLKSGQACRLECPVGMVAKAGNEFAEILTCSGDGVLHPGSALPLQCVEGCSTSYYEWGLDQIAAPASARSRCSSGLVALELGQSCFEPCEGEHGRFRQYSCGARGYLHLVSSGCRLTQCPDGLIELGSMPCDSSGERCTLPCAGKLREVVLQCIDGQWQKAEAP
eukprot:CAMPEP_0178463208 /NCGR_PEP_ID=MMETSP0689_2-20121128/50217_1 /TAXON_ID=160604 /ORGANISM="Amphidinium massartii, Strain CS-259" /LENGTH=598 /DNA_ID=CAMNT_0020090089 /DNA_START=124 /DNA_END=1916 /DNA_ORIENTATION=+